VACSSGLRPVGAESNTGGRPGEKKAQARLATDGLDGALADFSGDVAAAAGDDGPCGMLSAVAQRGAKRLRDDVGEHDPPHADSRPLLGRLPTAWSARDVRLFGVTTAGAARSPEPLVEGCGEVPPPIGTFPLVAELVNAVLGAVASARKGLAATPPTRPQGRPSTPAAQAAARQNKRLAAPRADVCTPRSLCVHHPLRTRARQTRGRITHALPQRRTLRALMEPGSAVCARRCRTQSALATLAPLRRRLRRFPPWGATLTTRCAPPLAKALTFLDDPLLPATSHAGERGNRRYRKRQKQVSRVRTPVQIRARLALDLWRAAQAEGRQHTLASLHHARAG
jgi:hypothetical protein